MNARAHIYGECMHELVMVETIVLECFFLFSNWVWTQEKKLQFIYPFSRSHTPALLHKIHLLWHMLFAFPRFHFTLLLFMMHTAHMKIDTGLSVREIGRELFANCTNTSTNLHLLVGGRNTIKGVWGSSVTGYAIINSQAIRNCFK